MSKAAKFADYKRAREGGGRSWKPAQDITLYDEVTEDQYKSIVKGRLQRDDFVVDDGIDGYADNGMDDWEAVKDSGGDQSEGDEHTRKRQQRSVKKSKTVKKVPPPPPPDISAYRPVISADKEEDFMSNILSSMDAAPVPVTKSRKRKSSPGYLATSSPISSGSRFSTFRDSKLTNGLTSSDPPDDSGITWSDDTPLSPAKKFKVDGNGGIGVTPAADRFTKMEFNTPGASDTIFDEMTFDTDDIYMELDLDPAPDAVLKMEEDDGEIGLRAPVPAPKLKLMVKDDEEKKEDTLPSWLSVHAALTVTDDALGTVGGHRSSSSSNVSALENDGSLNFYWIDYLESDGKVHFIGKVVDKQTGNYISCCVTVEGLERNLYVLPRDRRIDGGFDTDVTPTQDDVYDDFDRIRRQIGVKSWAAKWVKRKYAFGEGVPTGEADWMKVVYGFDEPQIPKDVSSPNFARVFGTNTSAFELLVLKRKIMGPCWLKIKKPEIDSKGVSWCKLEITISDPKDINPFPESDSNAPRDIPPLTVMSLSVRTIVNHKENKREIVCVSARTWANTHIDDPKPPSELPCTVHTYIRPLNNFPSGFEAKAKENRTSKIMPMKNERMLLNQLLVTINKTDPDVIVGHEFLGVSLDVLLHRMRELKPEHWSRIGRFRRSAKSPNVGKQGTNIKFLNGRLLCDLASDGAKGMISSTTWSLTEMCASHLKVERPDIDPDDTIKYLDGSLPSPDEMLTFIQHCETDAHFQMAIASKVQILPLTKQLTNLAGNSWNKTLNGGRAERNEYILLHEFHRLKYICPDKAWGKKSAAAVKIEAEEGDGAAVTTTVKGKKDKYKGGLVFEPKKGLWDKFILVMDFNSLYPSIIQEYNIDFTTVEKLEDEGGEEKIPEPPSSDVPQGVLPRLIATLVNRRRQVKSLMKDRSATPAKILQYDIKQQALKLTANSMYGCLGFEYSRFYARPLAALTTFKGREILTQTRELAESLRLDVVYGDTDSVFVNSNVTDLAEALKTAHEFKKHVNDRYKLLEIDLDGVFQRLLLLQKKKYAAVKVEEGGKTSIEIKGLDMKRREYCRLSKNVSQYVLDQILSGEDTEVVVEKIHEYLSTIGDNVRGAKMSIDEFIVFKRLGKNPEDYPDAKNQPHVQVALRLKTKGHSARAGDVIPYVFCLGDDGQTARTAQADKARHPDDIRKAGSEFKIDYEHYLSQQVLPPIERLCEPIEGTDRARLAECLGLDPTRYRTSTGSEFEERVFGTLDSQMADRDRFKDAAPFITTCTHCDGSVEFEPIYDRERSIVTAAGPTCLACSTRLSTTHLQIQLELQIRQHIAKYYEGWTECDDPTCRNRTRMMSVYGRRCMKPSCRGSVALEYSDLKLYNQLLYYASLFNAEKIAKGAKGTAKHGACYEVAALIDVNNAFLGAMAATVEKYLNHCGRRWVELDGLFSFMKL
ncbi:DNA polymerase alpha catalytic subunit [Ramaria rubella]|nr:DNA polymerase alpha catalytic subunit [Ramaria rubella]